MNLSRPSLKLRAIGFFLIAILVSTLLGGYLLNYYSDEFTEDISRRNLLLAHQIHHNVQLFLDHHVSELRKLRLAINKFGLDSIEVMKEELDRINAFHPLLETVQILDAKGTVRHLSPYDVEYIDIDMSGHDSFQSALDLSDQEVYWSDSFIPSNTIDPSVTVSLPINAGVLMAQLNLKVLSDIVSHPELSSHSQIVSHPIPYGSLIITITDSRGVAIAHPDHIKVTQRVNLSNLRSIRRAMDGESGTYSETWDGKNGLASVVLIPESGWVVTVFQGEKEALGIVIRARKVVMVAIAFLLGLTMLAFMFLQHQGMKPFRKLEERADLIAKGSYGEDLEADYLEFSGFVDSFNKMTGAVRGRELKLRASEERFRILFYEAAEPIYLMNEQGDLLAANKRACQSLGYSILEFVQMNVSHFIVGETREIVSKRLSKITGDEPVNAEGEHQRKDGTVFPVEVSIARMEGDGEYRFIALRGSWYDGICTMAML